MSPHSSPPYKLEISLWGQLLGLSVRPSPVHTFEITRFFKGTVLWFSVFDFPFFPVIEDVMCTIDYLNVMDEMGIHKRHKINLLFHKKLQI